MTSDPHHRWGQRCGIDWYGGKGRNKIDGAEEEEQEVRLWSATSLSFRRRWMIEQGIAGTARDESEIRGVERGCRCRTARAPNNAPVAIA